MSFASMYTVAAGKRVEYRAWWNMIRRCTDPANPNWPRYGGRGIKVCDRWLANFSHFYDDVGPRPAAGLSLDRINNDGNYEPGNVRWATWLEQARNTPSRRGPRMPYTERTLTINGVVRPQAEWARAAGIRPERLRSRLAAGIAPEIAVLKDIPRRPSRRLPITGRNFLLTKPKPRVYSRSVKKVSTIPPRQCLRCGNVWTPKTETLPKTCPSKGCRSPYWNRPRTRKATVQAIRTQPQAVRKSSSKTR